MRQEIQEQLKGKFAGIAISVEKEAAGPHGLPRQY